MNEGIERENQPEGAEKEEEKWGGKGEKKTTKNKGKKKYNNGWKTKKEKNENACSKVLASLLQARCVSQGRNKAGPTDKHKCQTSMHIHISVLVFHPCLLERPFTGISPRKGLRQTNVIFLS